MAEVASLILKVDSRGTQSATRDLDRLTDASGKAERATDSLARAVKIMGAAAAVGAGAALAVTAKWTREVIALGNELQRFSSIANSGLGEFQRWAVGAQSAGISQEKLADQLKDFNEKVGEFLDTGGGGMKDFFDQVAPKVGVTAEQFRKLSGPEGLQLYFNSLERAGLSQQQMSFYLESMASDTTALIPLLRNGGAGFREWAQQAERFGAIMTDDVAEGIAAAQRASVQLDQAMLGIKMRVVSEVLPAMEEFAELLGEEGTQKLLRDVADLLGEAAGAAVLYAGKMRDAGKAYRDWLADRGALPAGQLDNTDQLDERIRGLSRMQHGSDPLNMLRRQLFGDTISSELQAAIAERNRGQWRNVVSGADTVPTGGRGNGGGSATAELKDRTKARKELTQAEREYQALMEEIAAHDEVVSDRQRELGMARIQLDNERQEAAERASQSVRDLIADMEFEASLLGMSNIEQEKAIALRYAGAAATEDQREAIRNLVDGMARAREAGEDVRFMEDGARDLFGTIVTDSARASDALDRFFDNLKRRAADKLFEGLLSGFAGMAGGGGWAGFASGFASGFSGQRAAGGPVEAGGAYLVGENGPELFAPGHSGRVHPVGAAGGGATNVKLEVINNGPPMRAEQQTTRGPDGSQVIRVVLDAVAEDIAKGGRTAAAIRSRYPNVRS